MVPDAVNGTISLPMRRSVLASGGPSPCPLLELTCVLADASPTSFAPSRIVCTVPPSVGSAFLILIRNRWTTLPATAGYTAHAVTSVQPADVPMTGGSITVLGVGFGLGVCVDTVRASTVQVVVTRAPANASVLVFDPVTHFAPGVAALDRVYLPCNVTSWTDTAVTCEVPPGVDRAVGLEVGVGGRVNSTSGLFGFAAPVLYDATFAGGAPPTLGGTTMSINGTGFPPLPWPVGVTVGGRVCTVVPDTRSDSRVDCVVPRGAGAVDVALYTPLQPAANTVRVAYGGPLITSVTTPAGRPVDGLFPVQIRGQVRAGGPAGRGGGQEGLSLPPLPTLHLVYPLRSGCCANSHCVRHWPMQACLCLPPHIPLPHLPTNTELCPTRFQRDVRHHWGPALHKFGCE